MKTISELPDSEKARILRERRQKELHWYAIYVTPLHERQLLEAYTGVPDPYARTQRGRANRALAKLDPPIEAYVPIREEKHKWSDRTRIVPVVLTPGIIFVRIRLEERRRLYIADYVNAFLYNKDKKEPAAIDDEVMVQFRTIVEHETDISLVTPSVGDTVQILSGPYEGFVGEVVRDRGNALFQLRLTDNLAVALTIKEDQIKIVPRGTMRKIPDVRY
ncbi:MAG: KOW motif-containing protein [Bacteroidales bacterium]|nr:KOW motif-containing protein [Bacteroidales bacterium]